MTAPVVSKVCIRIHKLAVQRLKGIRDLTEVSFEDKPLTGIFGPNGIGKSTILHALAAAYRAPAGIAQAAHYRKYFPPLADDVWNGTRFALDQSFMMPDGSRVTRSLEYRKGSVTTQWNPSINRRPERQVIYIGIKSCLPDLEGYFNHNLSGAVATARVDALDTRVLKAASGILNCNYIEIADVRAPYHPSHRYTSLRRSDSGGVVYPSVMMGAGEQRLIRLLYAIERSRKNALILVDELDLMLHGDALRKMIDYLADHCLKYEKQLVFTSHREELLSLKDKINIRHIHAQCGKHICYPATDPDSLRRMTGRQEQPLEIFVEDKLAGAITRQVAEPLGMGRHVRIIPYGAATNCFSVYAGLLMKGEPCENSLFVLDGDEYSKPEERERRIAKAYSGTASVDIARRAEMLARIKLFALPAAENPEQYLHHLICSVAPAGLNPTEVEIQNVARDIVRPPDTHGYIYHIVGMLGGDPAVQLARVVALAAKHPDWAAYVRSVQEWLLERKAALGLA